MDGIKGVLASSRLRKSTAGIRRLIALFLHLLKFPVFGKICVPDSPVGGLSNQLMSRLPNPSVKLQSDPLETNTTLLCLLKAETMDVRKSTLNGVLRRLRERIIMF